MEEVEKVKEMEQIEEEEEKEIGCPIKMIMNNKCINVPITIGQYGEIYQQLRDNLTIWKQNRENIIVSTIINYSNVFL